MDKEYLKGDVGFYVFCDFDGHGIVEGTITAVCNDHIILTDADNTNYYIDEDYSKSCFRRTRDGAEQLLKTLLNGNV